MASPQRKRFLAVSDDTECEPKCKSKCEPKCEPDATYTSKYLKMTTPQDSDVFDITPTRSFGTRIGLFGGLTPEKVNEAKAIYFAIFGVSADTLETVFEAIEFYKQMFPEDHGEFECEDYDTSSEELEIVENENDFDENDFDEIARSINIYRDIFQEDLLNGCIREEEPMDGCVGEEEPMDGCVGEEEPMDKTDITYDTYDTYDTINIVHKKEYINDFSKDIPDYYIIKH
jgi:hypothetical protein